MTLRAPAAPAAQARPRSTRRRLAGLVTVALVGTAAPLVAGTAPASAAEGDGVRMVQANILTGMPWKRFSSDVREVLGQQPDFVTYNEVPYRRDDVLAPDGYALHRSTRNRYTAATPVAWRTDRWRKIDQGTFKVSGYRDIPEGRHTRLGLRFANWVTLRSADGRTLSVVSAHVAPKVNDMPDLRRSSVRRIGELVKRLSPQGAVLVGGDFNLHYKSGKYPRDVLEAAGMTPTYDTLGNHFSTGDHGGYTIDYVFNRGADQLKASGHRPVELHSDHDAVVADLGWQVDAPDQTREVVSDPDGGDAARRAVVTELERTIRDTEPGSTVEVVTAGLDLWAVFRRLRGALARDVHVRLVTRSGELTRQERRLAGSVRRSGDAESSVRHCDGDCRRAWWEAGGPRTMLFVSDANRAGQVRADVNRNLTRAVMTRRTKLVYRNGDSSLESGQRLLRVVG
jgi:endonuclease/exonuclease/phosphatase (EEP) superfamily protein YafD